ncbi:hypothetical protein ACIOHC_40195 [Streptomyces sp. NPDC088252]|uniref:hypothetical protein n=1 Tax=unclassified Streptomyces TaxID=2593676 RepID=UPI003445165D
MTDGSWTDTVVSWSTGPYFFAAEAVLPFLTADAVRSVVDVITERFCGSLLALGTAGPGVVDAQDEHDALSKVEARMQWACAKPAEIAVWCPGPRCSRPKPTSRRPDALFARGSTAYGEYSCGSTALQQPPTVGLSQPTVPVS